MQSDHRSRTTGTLMDKYTVAKLELKWQECVSPGWRGRYLDFVVDGCPFRDRVPWAEVVAKSLGPPPTMLLEGDGTAGRVKKSYNKMQQICSSYPTRLGHMFPKGNEWWWQKALSELL